jgi:hypothetical protein
LLAAVGVAALMVHRRRKFRRRRLGHVVASLPETSLRVVSIPGLNE